MPQVKIKSASGPALISYTIATPTCANAQAIDPTLPTVLFLHPVYIGHIIFHPQFANPSLRRFNLVGFDMRCHGETVGSVPSTYRRLDVAADVIKVMEALKLPPCHLFGLSLGACVALQTAISSPKKVLSLFMVAPLPLIEPDHIGAGRQEIYDFWVDGFKDPESVDEATISEAIFGALQLGFNGDQGSLPTAFTQYILPLALQRWAPEHFEEFHTISVDFFVDRKPHPPQVLQKIKCPIHLVHCGGDIAYPLEYAEELRDALQSAGLDVKLSQVEDAAHFGCVTHPERINALFHSWVVQNTKARVPAAQDSVMSPFDAALVKAGYMPEECSDSEDELFQMLS